MGWYTNTKEVKLGIGDRTMAVTELRYGAIARDILIAISLVTIAGMYGCPRYNVWQQGQKGEAELSRAEQNRKIAVQEAQAKLEAAKLQAKAEVERARGIAEANKIIADGLKNNEEYLRYLWIDKVAGTAQHEVIYVPTEAALPLLEAGRSRAAPEK